MLHNAPLWHAWYSSVVIFLTFFHFVASEYTKVGKRRSQFIRAFSSFLVWRPPVSPQAAPPVDHVFVTSLTIIICIDQSLLRDSLLLLVRTVAVGDR